MALWNQGPDWMFAWIVAIRVATGTFIIVYSPDWKNVPAYIDIFNGIF